MQQTTDFPTNLDALQNIQSISGDLIVEVHDGPFSLLGLSQLTTVGGAFRLSDVGAMPNILNFDGLEYLISVDKFSLVLKTTVDFTPLNALVNVNELKLDVWFDGLGTPISLIEMFPGIEHLNEGFSCHRIIMVLWYLLDSVTSFLLEPFILISGVPRIF
ncbi:MAG: hypothetical protein IPP69_10030 [Flavobacteriales bacterium]|nr:hypothetical protein [Flavobacteriales bacterium]